MRDARYCRRVNAPAHGWTEYDELPYPGFPYAQSHPDRLATQATLFGMTAPEVASCRVLEVGCGDGGNLIAMAYGLPEGSFVGVDRAPSAVARAQGFVRELGLGNVELVCADLSDIGAGFGEFDFIVAHGVYSWVADPVRDRLMALCRANLAANGVAFVSYNTLPGGHVRMMLREMLLFDGRGVDAPQERAQRARAFLHQLGEAQAGSGRYRQLLAEELERLRAQSDAAIMHDDLEAINRPVYFHEFVAHAATHELQYLAEADFFEMPAAASSPAVLAVLAQHGDDLVAREQYLDFLTGRLYRQTLLCRIGIHVDRRLRAEVMPRFLIAAQARLATPDAVIEDRSPATFRGPRGATLHTDEPIIKLALAWLTRSWPQSVAFETLLEHVSGPAPGHGARLARKDDAVRVLCQGLLRAYGANLVELHIHAPRFASAPSERPRASALARLQASAGEWVTTLKHDTLRIEDGAGRRLLTLLDGTRDRAELIRSLSADAQTAGDIDVQLDSRLERLAHLALLED
jgi:SAM-dependent methyltransferase